MSLGGHLLFLFSKHNLNSTPAQTPRPKSIARKRPLCRKLDRLLQLGHPPAPAKLAVPLTRVSKKQVLEKEISNLSCGAKWEASQNPKILSVMIRRRDIRCRFSLSRVMLQALPRYTIPKKKWSDMLAKQILPIGLYGLPLNHGVKGWVVIWRPELVSRKTSFSICTRPCFCACFTIL